MPPPTCKLSTTFVASRCGNHDVSPDQTLKPPVLPYVPPTSRAFDVLVLSDASLGSAKSVFLDMGGSDDTPPQVGISTSEEPTDHIAALVIGVVVPDLSTLGTSLKLARCHGTNGQRGEAPLSKPVPSGHGIVGIHRVHLPPRLAGEKAQREEVLTGLNYLLLDAIGNVFVVSNVLSGSDELPEPRLIVKASTQEPSAPPLLGTHACDPVGAGTPAPGGWVGLAFPSFLCKAVAPNVTVQLPDHDGAVDIDAAGVPTLAAVVGGRHPYFAVGREYGKDVRVAELIGGEWAVTASFNCVHAPTSIVFIGASDEVLAIADGPLLTVADVDVRVASPSVPYFSQTPRTLFHPLTQPKHIVWSVSSLTPAASQLIKWTLEQDVACTEQLAALKSSGPRTPPTTELKELAARRAAYRAISQVLPNCVVVASSDRSITVLDARKWTKVGSVHNVLKYDALTATVVVVPGERTAPEDALLSVGCVVGGIDSEVRCVPCLEGSSVAHSLQQNGAAPTGKKGLANGKLAGTAGGAAAAENTEEDLPAVSSFRGRINTAIHGEDLWHGAWHPVLIPSGGAVHTRVAAGLTATMQLYFAVAEHQPVPTQ